MSGGLHTTTTTAKSKTNALWSVDHPESPSGDQVYNAVVISDAIAENKNTPYPDMLEVKTNGWPWL